MLLRYFGIEGLRRRIAYHLELGERFSSWIDGALDFERLAPVPFSTICFRYRPASLADREDEPAIAEELDRVNVALMDAINRYRPGLPVAHPAAGPLHDSSGAGQSSDGRFGPRHGLGRSFRREAAALTVSALP